MAKLTKKMKKTNRCTCAAFLKEKAKNQKLTAEVAELKRRLDILESEKKESYQKYRENFREAMNTKQNDPDPADTITSHGHI
ncbi:hypothetical protein CAEBREN_15998 [Caenorhabditis brenneri]|uniref:Uncharacterized protein n=1 Tax=Caenorhabditis brenneri TaxID=135651 RepID=G0PAB7_CAEBE|nr:hypothetical protein CAEBREN_15998 [Caenorhabditis brenneri]